MFYKVKFNRNIISEIEIINDKPITNETEMSKYYTENGKNIYDYVYINADHEDDLKEKVSLKVVPLD